MHDTLISLSFQAIQCSLANVTPSEYIDIFYLYAIITNFTFKKKKIMFSLWRMVWRIVKNVSIIDQWQNVICASRL